MIKFNLLKIPLLANTFIFTDILSQAILSYFTIPRFPSPSPRSQAFYLLQTVYRVALNAEFIAIGGSVCARVAAVKVVGRLLRVELILGRRRRKD